MSAALPTIWVTPTPIAISASVRSNGHGVARRDSVIVISRYALAELASSIWSRTADYPARRTGPAGERADVSPFRYSSCHLSPDVSKGGVAEARNPTETKSSDHRQEGFETMTSSIDTIRPDGLRAAEQRLAAGLARHSIDLLRISLGLVFFGFGVLKFIPGLSPAESLAASTLDILTFGIIPERLGLIGVAALETTIGLLLLSGRWL